MKVILENENIFKKENWKSVFDRIFAVCKKDPIFKVNERTEPLIIEIKELEEKLEKNKKIILNADKYRKDMERKVKLLDEQNYELKSTVLEKLGSEI
jgi:hypothetical protein